MTEPAEGHNAAEDLDEDRLRLDPLEEGMDPPEHRKFRTLVSQAFTPRVVQGLEPRIEAVCRRLLGTVADRDRFDVVDTLAYPLPIIVIAELLGIPYDKVTQGGLFPIAYTIGTDFKPGPRRDLAPTVESMYVNTMIHVKHASHRCRFRATVTRRTPADDRGHRSTPR